MSEKRNYMTDPELFREERGDNQMSEERTEPFDVFVRRIAPEHADLILARVRHAEEAADRAEQELMRLIRAVEDIPGMGALNAFPDARKAVDEARAYFKEGTT